MELHFAHFFTFPRSFADNFDEVPALGQDVCYQEVKNGQDNDDENEEDFEDQHSPLVSILHPGAEDDILNDVEKNWEESQDPPWPNGFSFTIESTESQVIEIGNCSETRVHPDDCSAKWNAAAAGWVVSPPHRGDVRVIFSQVLSPSV